MRILFVDDKADLRYLFQLGLAKPGHLVSTADDGMEAIAEIKAHDFDIIIMDIEMPRMNGWEAIRRIRTLPRGKKISIVIFTSKFLKLSPQQIQQSGANGILNKPMTPGEVLAYVSQMDRY